MIKPLRKYHFIVWHVWAFLLPLAFILAIIVRPSLPASSSTAKDTFVAELKSLTDSTSLVQIRVIKPLTVPSCLVFNVIDDKDILLGKLDQQGSYTYTIPKSEQAVTIKLYDAIHKTTITSFTLIQSGPHPKPFSKGEELKFISSGEGFRVRLTKNYQTH